LFNPLLKSAEESGERNQFIFIGILVAVILIDFTILVIGDYSIDINDNLDNTDEWEITFSNMSLTSNSEILISDNNEEVVTFEIPSNLSDDGWMVQEIYILITYGETSLGDFDCDTVSAEFDHDEKTGVSSVSEQSSGESSDCTEIQMNKAWRYYVDGVYDNISKLEAENILEMEDVGIDVYAYIRVNTDSTIPNNDNDENISVDFTITLQKVESITRV
tara:strand:- start:104 stop:760 length:657 start_codon:yes stop_codon:yes gene_type:complete